MTVFADFPHDSSVPERLEQLDWTNIAHSATETGSAVLKNVITAAECRVLEHMYFEEDRFRSRVVMSRHSFGRGEYKYFQYPLPQIVQSLRESLYPRLAPIANAWNEMLKVDTRYPEQLGAFLELCHRAGQTRPTPLLLRYVEGDYNCLHQDLYGERVFPLQVAFLLSEPGKDFEGGEFVLNEQRPRMQTRAEVVPLRQGDGVVFAVHHRPARGTRGVYRVNMRHGVSTVRSGLRHTLGVIFHDAE